MFLTSRARQQPGRTGPDDHQVKSSVGLRRCAMVFHLACRPCSSALRIKPMPPSSPAANMPGTVGFEVWRHERDVQLRRSLPEYQGDGALTDRRDAARRPMQSPGLTSAQAAADQAEHRVQLLLRTGLQA